MASTATNGASATANGASNGTSNGATNGAVHGAEKGGKLLAGVDLGAKAVTDFIDGKMKGHDFSAGDAFSLIGKALKAFWDPEAAASAVGLKFPRSGFDAPFLIVAYISLLDLTHLS